MSHDATEQTKLGPGFDVTGISGAGATIYANDVDMEDTASSSVRVVGEIVPDTTASSLGLLSMDVPAMESAQGVMGPFTVETWDQSDAEAGSTSNAPSGETVSNPGASGSQATSDVSHQQATTTT